MRLTVLASGSSGNCALIECDGRAVVLDAGISARETLRRVEAAGAGSARIEAVLLTHEHSDHTTGARVLARRLGVPVLGTRGTLEAAEGALADVPSTECVTCGDTLEIAGMKICVFATAHDSAEPCGYTFTASTGRKLGIATDTGVFTEAIAIALEGCHTIGLEANHDERMLANGPYPAFLKRRISGDLGHLSNAAASVALGQVSWGGLVRVIGLHLSEQNNTPARARASLVRASGAPEAVETVGRLGGTGCEV